MPLARLLQDLDRLWSYTVTTHRGLGGSRSPLTWMACCCVWLRQYSELQLEENLAGAEERIERAG